MNHPTPDTPFDDEGFELEPMAELAALRLSEGASHAEAAMAIGREAKWIQRRLKDDPAFRQRVRDLKRERVAQASARLGALLDQVWAMAERNLTAERPADQIAAGRLIVERERSYSAISTDAAEELDDVRQQMADLEAKLADALATVHEEA
jgi:hypothetical protein